MTGTPEGKMGGRGAAAFHGTLGRYGTGEGKACTFCITVVSWGAFLLPSAFEFEFVTEDLLEQSFPVL